MLALLVLTGPARAWDFVANPVCTVWQDTPDLAVRLTYDPTQSEPFAITLTRRDPWPETERFRLGFDGANAMTIGTSRHRLSDDERTLTVTDTGFGNVLDGLSFNTTATARAGDTAISIDLAGARPAVDAFRACGVVPSA